MAANTPEPDQPTGSTSTREHDGVDFSAPSIPSLWSGFDDPRATAGRHEPLLPSPYPRASISPDPLDDDDLWEAAPQFVPEGGWDPEPTPGWFRRLLRRLRIGG